MESTSSDDLRTRIALSLEEFRRLGYREVDMLAEHFASLGRDSCRTPVPDDVRRDIMEQPLPAVGSDPEALLGCVASTVLRYPRPRSESVSGLQTKH